ncbi:Nicastrin [Hypsibius exemplaris]|uniref:Nicastrin n=1 Tax=Hypsibius exemplaris TaxID=2072580 RepID=A0A9X6NPJ0_HYPEX|nr:Nicastrin [Hypsibius exemplaris]
MRQIKSINQPFTDMAGIFRLVVGFTIGLCALFSGQADADRIREKIYYTFDKHAFCMRRLNGTHEIGCSSSPSGDVGVLHYVTSPEDVQYVSRDGPHAPYIAIINSLDVKFYNLNIFKTLQDSNRVRGVILIKYDNESLPESFSPDKTCPNEGYGFYEDSPRGSCGGIPWNAAGNGMLFQRWNFPIFMLYQDADIDYLLNNCTYRFNQPKTNETSPAWPLCSAELKSYMLAAADSQTCIRRSNLLTNLNPQTRCDPLQGFNVWASLNPVNQTAPRKANSTIIIAARLDASGVFDFIPGVESSVSGLVTLMLVAESLAKVRSDLTDREIMFVLFNGEAFDYIGSSRLVYDMQKGEFPQKVDLSSNDTVQNAVVRLEDIDLFIELSQLGLVREGKFFLHTDPVSSADAHVRDRVRLFSSISGAEATKANMTSVFLNGTQLPPASFQQFLRSNVSVPGVVITDHQREYQNHFYNSEFDSLKGQMSDYPVNMSDAEAYNYATSIAINAQKVATVVARSVYKFVTGNALKEEANLTTSANLMYCYTYKSNCSLFISYFNGTADQYLKASPLSLYIGVSRGDGSHPVTYASQMTLGNLIGERVNLTEADCKAPAHDKMNKYYFYYNPVVNGTRSGYCVKTNTDLSQAKSPAFLLDDYSGKYSTWTESIWASTSIRIFLQPDPKQDLYTLAFGIVATVILTALIFGMSRAAGDIFLASEDA